MFGCAAGGGGGESATRGDGPAGEPPRPRKHTQTTHPRRLHDAPGEGKPKMVDEKETTVYKRAVGMDYQLKLKASR